MKKNTSIIAHLDMDAFFAAVEERDTPRFAGQPLVVGADPHRGRGVVSTANYPARRYGIRSAMPISQAWRRSENARLQGQPPVIFLSGNYKKYSLVSESIMAYIQTRIPLIEQTSVDEAYLDLTFTGSFATAQILCQEIKNYIARTQRLTASVGIGPNKLIAKIASDFQKPNGLTVVRPEKVIDFLNPLPLRAIPGVGPKTEQVLLQLGLKKVCDATQLPQSALESILGKWGEALFKKIHGQGSATLHAPAPPLSVGSQTTFPLDTLSAMYVVNQLFARCEQVFRHFNRHGFHSFRTVVVTARFNDFTTASSGRTLPRPANTLAKLKKSSLQLLLPFLDNRRNPQLRPLRLIGVRVENFN
jgi:nucleotidyltransferase/DNA polymerase involved in DNA repair